MAGSLERQRVRRRLGIILAFTALLGLILYGVLRPDAEEREYNALRNAFLSGNPRELSRDERREMRRRLDELSPETRRKLERDLLREQLRRVREETRKLSPDEKTRRIDEMLERMRTSFGRLSNEQRTEIKSRMASPEAKARVRESLDFYYTEFTAEERQLLDPLLNEMLGQLDAL